MLDQFQFARICWAEKEENLESEEKNIWRKEAKIIYTFEEEKGMTYRQVYQIIYI